MHIVYKIAKWLLIIGGLNWGLIGLSMLFNVGNLDVIYMIFGGMPMLEALIYILVGVAAVLRIFKHCSCAQCKDCNCAQCGPVSAVGA